MHTPEYWFMQACSYSVVVVENSGSNLLMELIKKEKNVKVTEDSANKLNIFLGVFV